MRNQLAVLDHNSHVIRPPCVNESGISLLKLKFQEEQRNVFPINDCPRKLIILQVTLHTAGRFN